MRTERPLGDAKAEKSETPIVSDDSPTAGRSLPLAALGAALRNLHRALLARARHDYERERGAVLSAGELLQLLTSDARFAWLRSLSELIVDVDVYLEADPAPGDDEASAVRAEVERLIAPVGAGGDGPDFAVRYWDFLHADPQVAISHGELRQALDRLPAADTVDEARALHDRHRWAEVRRHRK
jgi:hypothetical protein